MTARLSWQIFSCIFWLGLIATGYLAVTTESSVAQGLFPMFGACAGGYFVAKRRGKQSK